MEAATDFIFIVDAAIYNAVGVLFVVLGLLVTIRFLGFPDLTADGSFTVGAGAFARLITTGFPLIISIGFAILVGCAAGTATACLNQVFKLGKVVSSILVTLVLVTATPYVTGGTTIGLLYSTNALSKIQQWDLDVTRQCLPNADFSLHIGFSLLMGCLGLVATGLLLFFFGSQVGLEIRYLGSARSPNLLPRGKRIWLTFIGLALGNGLISIGGAVEAIRRGGFNQNMGTGILLSGLLCLVLGESLVKYRQRRDNLSVREYCLAVVLGAVGCSLMLQALLQVGMTFIDTRLTSAVLLFALLAIASRRHPNTARLF